MTTAYELDPLRAPALAEGDEMIYCEHGRILYRTPEKKPGDGVDCRSHWFRVVKNGGMYSLLVRHGGGDERVRLGYAYKQPETIFGPLESDARYWLMHILLDVHHNAERAAAASTASAYKAAFVDGRLKKRKLRGQAAVKVWIDRPIIVREAA